MFKSTKKPKGYAEAGAAAPMVAEIRTVIGRGRACRLMGISFATYCGVVRGRRIMAETEYRIHELWMAVKALKLRMRRMSAELDAPQKPKE
jgi:hypothetical protein